MKFNTHMSAKEFYLRSFTWGLPVNIGGAVVALAMLATGHRPQKYGNCIRFEVGDNWGGGSCGIFIFTGKNVPEAVKQHEAGHSLQNCYYGPLMPLLVNLPSTTRFLVRGALEKLLPGSVKTDYYSIWFENQASRLGTEYMRNLQAAAKPEQPEVQAKTDRMEVRAKPEVREKPDRVEVQAKPEVREKPESPGVHEKPEYPGAQTIPEQPEAREKSDRPEGQENA